MCLARAERLVVAMVFVETLAERTTERLACAILLVQRLVAASSDPNSML
jgi:hypothetical protein